MRRTRLDGLAAEVAVRLAGRAVEQPDPAGTLREVLQMMGFIPTPEIEAHRRHPVPRAVPGGRTETAARAAAREPVSDCCGAEVETAGRVTRYYVCTRCDQPCDARAS